MKKSQTKCTIGLPFSYQCVLVHLWNKWEYTYETLKVLKDIKYSFVYHLCTISYIHAVYRDEHMRALNCRLKCFSTILYMKQWVLFAFSYHINSHHRLLINTQVTLFILGNRYNVIKGEEYSKIVTDRDALCSNETKNVFYSICWLKVVKMRIRLQSKTTIF